MQKHFNLVTIFLLDSETDTIYAVGTNGFANKQNIILLVMVPVCL